MLLISNDHFEGDCLTNYFFSRLNAYPMFIGYAICRHMDHYCYHCSYVNAKMVSSLASLLIIL